MPHTASPDLLLLQSSQSSGSQLEPINQNSQVSDSSQIHGMTLKYSDDEITDEELRELNLQTAAQQYIDGVRCSAKDYTYSVSDKPVSPKASVNEQALHSRWTEHPAEPDCSKAASSQLPNGTPGIRLQILYLEEFFGTTWYLIWEDTFELYAIYDAIFYRDPIFCSVTAI